MLFFYQYFRYKFAQIVEKAWKMIYNVEKSEKKKGGEKMQNKLDLLYGANLYHKVTGYGKGHVLEIKSQVLNERYTKESLLEEQFTLLSEVLFHPLLNETTFVEAKKLLNTLTNKTE